jgi:hypothetical protein
MIMGIVAIASTGAYVYTLIQALPGSHFGSTQTLAVTVVFGVFGVGYALWAAVLNRSIIVGLLGPTEIFLAAFLAFLLVRKTRAEHRGLSVFLAVIAFGLFLYPWLKADVILRRLRRWTGLV